MWNNIISEVTLLTNSTDAETIRQQKPKIIAPKILRFLQLINQSIIISDKYK